MRHLNNSTSVLDAQEKNFSIFVLIIFLFGISFFNIMFYAATKIPLFVLLPIFIVFIFPGLNLVVNFAIVAIFLIFKNIFILISYLILGDYFNSDAVPILLSIDFSYFVLIFLLSLVFLMQGLRKYRIVFFTLLVFYVLCGMAVSNIISAATYSRFYFVPFFIFLLVSYGGKYLKYLPDVIVVIILFYLLYMSVEEFTPDFYHYIKINEYVNIKYWNDSLRANSGIDVIESLGTNIGGMRVTRLIGPQFHPISSGYIFLFSIVLFSAEKKWLLYLFAPFIIVGLFLTSKGAFVAGICLGIVFSFKKIACLRRLIPSIFACYTIAMFIVASVPGLTSGYEHLAGLLGALENLPTRVFGLGIGTGGTMSIFKGVEYGGESGFGAVVSHMGIIGIVIYLTLIVSLINVIRKCDGKIFYYACYLVVILINGFLQEEALLPSATFLGWLLFSFYGLSYFENSNSIFNKLLYR